MPTHSSTPPLWNTDTLSNVPSPFLVSVMWGHPKHARDLSGTPGCRDKYSRYSRQEYGPLAYVGSHLFDVPEQTDHCQLLDLDISTDLNEHLTWPVKHQMHQSVDSQKQPIHEYLSPSSAQPRATFTHDTSCSESMPTLDEESGSEHSTQMTSDSGGCPPEASENGNVIAKAYIQQHNSKHTFDTEILADQPPQCNGLLIDPIKSTAAVIFDQSFEPRTPPNAPVPLHQSHELQERRFRRVQRTPLPILSVCIGKALAGGVSTTAGTCKATCPTDRKVDQFESCSLHSPLSKNRKLCSGSNRPATISWRRRGGPPNKLSPLPFSLPTIQKAWGLVFAAVATLLASTRMPGRGRHAPRSRASPEVKLGFSEPPNSGAKARSRRRRRADEDLGDNAETPVGPLTTRPPHTEVQPSFACPYLKRSLLENHHCLGRKLAKISYVKQHLYRVHGAPLHCETCGSQFQSAESQMQHIQAANCEARAFSMDGMTLKQQVAVSKTTARKISEVDKWFQIWDILFPTIPRPESPFVENPFVEAITSMRSYYRGPGSQIINNILREEGVNEPIADRISSSLVDRALGWITDGMRTVPHHSESFPAIGPSSVATDPQSQEPWHPPATNTLAGTVKPSSLVIAQSADNWTMSASPHSCEPTHWLPASVSSVSLEEYAMPQTTSYTATGRNIAPLELRQTVQSETDKDIDDLGDPDPGSDAGMYFPEFVHLTEQ
jgi:hypothetical protein